MVKRTRRMMIKAMVFLGYLIFLSVPVVEAADAGVHPLEIAPEGLVDQGSREPDQDHYEGFDGIFPHALGHLTGEQQGARAGGSGGDITTAHVVNPLLNQATIVADVPQVPKGTKGADAAVTGALDDVSAVSFGNPLRVLTVPEQGQQAEIKTIIKTVASATERMMEIDGGGKQILLALRLLEIMRTLENNAEMQKGNVLKTFGVAGEFAQAKLLLENAINNRRITLSLKIQSLYGEYESTRVQAKPFSTTFKEKIEALFVNVPSGILDIVHKEDASVADFFTFQEAVRNLLRDPLTPQTRKQFLEAVKNELSSALVKEQVYQGRLEKMQSVAPVFKGVFEALDAQDRALQEQQRQVPREPQNAYELLQVLKQALLAAGVPVNESLMPEANDTFEQRVAALPAKIERLKALADAARTTADQLAKIRMLRGKVRTEEAYQEADADVKRLSISLKTIIEMHKSLQKGITQDQVVIRNALMGARDFVEGRLTDISQTMRQRIDGIYKGIEEELGTMEDVRDAGLAQKQSLAALKNQLITQQATDFTNDKSLMEAVADNFRSFNVAECKVICEALALRDFSLKEAIALVDPGLKGTLEKVQAFETRVQSELSKPTGDVVAVQKSLNDVFGEDGSLKRAFNEEWAYIAKIVDRFGYSMSDLVALKDRFTSAYTRAVEKLAQFPAGTLKEIRGLMGSFAFPASAEGENVAMSGPYDAQNKLYVAIREMMGCREELVNLVKRVPVVLGSRADKPNYLVERINDFYKGQKGWPSLIDDEAGKELLKIMIEKMATPAYIKEAPVSDEVRNAVARCIGEEVLNLSYAVKTVEGFVVFSEQAALVKEKAMALHYKPDVLVDWRIIPQDFLTEIGKKWLETVKCDQGGNLLLWRDKKMLVDAWKKGLEAVQGNGGQPFRDIAVIAFATPLDESLYFDRSSSQVIETTEQEKQEGQVLINNLPFHQDTFSKAATSYDTFLAANVGQERAGIDYLQTIAARVATLGKLTPDDVLFMISDISSFEQSLESGKSSWWQQDLLDRTAAVKEALSRLVTAHAVTDSAIKEQLLVDFKARLARINEILLVGHPTPDQMQELHVWASIEPIEKALVDLFDFDNQSELLKLFDTFDQQSQNNFLPSFDEYYQARGMKEEVEALQQSFNAFLFSSKELKTIQQQVSTKRYVKGLEGTIQDVVLIQKRVQGFLSQCDEMLAYLKKINPQTPEIKKWIKSLTASRKTLSTYENTLDAYQTTWSQAVEGYKTTMTDMRQQFLEGNKTLQAYEKALSETSDLPEVAAWMRELESVQKVKFAMPDSLAVEAFLKNPVTAFDVQVEEVNKKVKLLLDDAEKIKQNSMLIPSAKIQQLKAIQKQIEAAYVEIQATGPNVLLEFNNAAEIIPVSENAGVQFDRNAKGKALLSEVIKLKLIALLDPENPSVLALPREELFKLASTREQQLRSQGEEQEAREVRDFKQVLGNDVLWALAIRRMEGNPLIVNGETKDAFMGKVMEMGTDRARNVSAIDVLIQEQEAIDSGLDRGLPKTIILS